MSRLFQRARDNSITSFLCSLRIDSCRFSYELSANVIEITSKNPDLKSKAIMDGIAYIVQHSLLHLSLTIEEKTIPEGGTTRTLAIRIHKSTSIKVFHKNLTSALQKSFCEKDKGIRYELRELCDFDISGEMLPLLPPTRSR